MGWALSLLSGVLISLSYPTRWGPVFLPDLGWLAWVAWVPLFYALGRLERQDSQLVSGKRFYLFQVFALGFLAGLFHYGLSQYWLISAMKNFGGLSALLSTLVFLLLSIILAFFWGFAVFLSAWVGRRFNLPVPLIRPWMILVVELMRHHWPATGYPWSQMAATQGGNLIYLQLASLVGAYGLSFLIYVFNEALALLLQRWRKRAFIYSYVAVAWVLFGAGGIYGYSNLKKSQPIGETVKIGLVQPNISQAQKWDTSNTDWIVERLQNYEKELSAAGADLVLWPEAAIPYKTPYDDKFFPLKSRGPHALITGSVTFSKRSYFRDGMVYNSALLIGPDQDLLDFYHKRRLVPFGEYVPYRDLFFFAKKLTVDLGDMGRGKSYHPMNWEGKSVGVLICYEDVFPDISTKMALSGARVLINLTNDAWYGKSSAAYQHQVYSQLRAVETGRWLVRATNTGISSVIDSKGRIQWQSELDTQGSFLAEVPLRDQKTFYLKYGSYERIIFLGVPLLLLLGTPFKRKKPHR